MKIMLIEQNAKYKNHRIPVGSVLLQTENGIVYVCENFTMQNDFVHVWIWNKAQWCNVIAKNDYTKIMIEFYQSELHKRKEKLRKDNKKYANMMKHDRKRKSGGNGQRLGFSGTVTEYECSKNPLHDFRRSMYVQWN